MADDEKTLDEQIAEAEANLTALKNRRDFKEFPKAVYHDDGTLLGIAESAEHEAELAKTPAPAPAPAPVAADVGGLANLGEKLGK